jgi:transposase
MSDTKNIKDEIISLREGGLSYSIIQKKLKCSKATIHSHCKKHGLEDIGLKRNKVDEAKSQAIREFCKTHTIKEAQEHFNLSRSTIKTHKAPYVRLKDRV